MIKVDLYPVSIIIDPIEEKVLIAVALKIDKKFLNTIAKAFPKS